MNTIARPLVFFAFLFSSLVFSQIEESYVDFTLSPARLQNREIQVAYEWLEPSEFKTKEMAVTDLIKIASLHQEKNHMVAAKVAFIANRSFDNLSHASLNTKSFISKMLNATAIQPKAPETWIITNKVKAYGLPFKITFDLRFREVSSSAIGTAGGYFKDEASGISGNSRERFMVLDMSNFSQLMYRNYSIVYMKELNHKETLIVATVIAGFNKDMADKLFDHPPINHTRKTMMNNFRSQIMQMVREIQNN
jgi:hypothetical protein